MQHLKRPALGLTVIAGLILALPTVAGAAETVPPTQPTLPLNTLAFWSAVISIAVTGISYVVNKYAPWVSQPAKALFLVALTAAANVVYQLIEVGDFAFDTRHLQLVAYAFVGAIVSHYGFKAGEWNLKLGAGQNAGLSRNTEPSA